MEKLKSRKLWAMVLGAVLTTLNGTLAWIPEDQMQWMIGLIMTYIGGQSVVDAASGLNR